MMYPSSSANSASSALSFFLSPDFDLPEDVLLSKASASSAVTSLVMPSNVIVFLTFLVAEVPESPEAPFDEFLLPEAPLPDSNGFEVGALPELLFGDPDFDPELLLPEFELLLLPVPWLLFGFEEFDPDFPELLELLLVELLLAPEPAELLVADGLDELFEPSLDPSLPAPYPDLVPELDPWFPVCLP